MVSYLWHRAPNQTHAYFRVASHGTISLAPSAPEDSSLTSRRVLCYASPSLSYTWVAHPMGLGGPSHLGRCDFTCQGIASDAHHINLKMHPIPSASRPADQQDTDSHPKPPTRGSG
eukprot:352411-Chlamydomonas_euryale.AAC.1